MMYRIAVCVSVMGDMSHGCGFERLHNGDERMVTLLCYIIDGNNGDEDSISR